MFVCFINIQNEIICKIKKLKSNLKLANVCFHQRYKNRNNLQKKAKKVEIVKTNLPIYNYEDFHLAKSLNAKNNYHHHPDRLKESKHFYEPSYLSSQSSTTIRGEVVISSVEK